MTSPEPRFDVEKLQPFLEDIEKGLQDLINRVNNAGTPGKRLAAKTQALFCSYFLEDVDAKLALLRSDQLADSVTRDPVWDNTGDVIEKFYRLTEIYRVASDCSIEVLGKLASPKLETVAEEPLELVTRIVEYCQVDYRELKNHWSGISNFLMQTEKSLNAEREIERQLVAAINFVYDWRSTASFQSFAFVLLGRLMTDNHVERLRSDFKSGTNPFGFLPLATNRHFDCGPDELFDNVKPKRARERSDER